jgi:hypothetical protein
MELDYSYVSVQLKQEFQAEIISKLILAGIAPESKHELHCTMVYDERDIAAPLCNLVPASQEFRANIISLDTLGDGLVFHFTSTDMLEEFRRLKEGGYVHSFGTPLFHMSLKYDFDKYEVLALNNLFGDWGGRTLVFHNEQFGVKKPKKK